MVETLKWHADAGISPYEYGWQCEDTLPPCPRKLILTKFLTVPPSGLEVAVFLQFILAVSFFVFWRKDKKPKLVWLALAYVMLAATSLLFNPLQLATMPSNMMTPDGRTWAVYSSASLLVLLWGVVSHLNAGGSKIAQWWWGILLLPLLCFLAALLFGVPITRAFANACVSLSVVVLGVLCLVAGNKEKISGYYGAWVACWTVPLIIWVGFLQNLAPVITRTLLTLPALLLGLSLLVGTLQRRQNKLEQEVKLRAGIEEKLRQFNASLEEKVEQRTSDLRHMMIGLESFNRSVSHDLRGPLSSMAALADMSSEALAKGDADLVARVLPQIARRARSMHGMVNSLLQLAHVTECHLSCAVVDMNALVQQVVDDLAVANPDLPIKDAVHIQPLPSITSDKDLLLPVFMNLIGNALKFAKPGQLPNVEVSIMENVGHEMTFCVSDQGLGFAQDKAETLFKPFQRLHGNIVEGHGVGLSIVQRAIERMGGRIWAHAAPDEGASFYFTLPVLPQRQTS